MPTAIEMIEVLASDPSGMGRDELLAGLSSAEDLRSWIAAREGRFARALRDLPKDPSSPAKDLAGELGREQNVGPGQAKKRAERAEQLGELPETEKTLESGGITDVHADAMARARSKADSKAQAALADKEAELLGHAGSESPWAFGQRLERFVKAHSADDGRTEWEKKKAARRARVWRDKDGMTRLSGTFDPESGQVVRSTFARVMEQLWRRDHQDHPADEQVPATVRDDEQRGADALTEICRRADEVDGPARRNDQAVVFLSHHDLLDKLNEAGIDACLGDGTPVPASVARRMACSAGIIPMVLDGDSVPLDLGRAARYASRWQRLGLRAQWDTCAIADCTVPFDWTQVHHLDPFAEDGHHGMTDLDNLIPACDHGHDLAHTPGWTIEKLADGSVITTAPDGTTWHRQPNGPATRQRPTQPPPAATAPAGQPAATLFTEAA
jgi:hypothetical protein